MKNNFKCDIQFKINSKNVIAVAIIHPLGPIISMYLLRQQDSDALEKKTQSSYVAVEVIPESNIESSQNSQDPEPESDRIKFDQMS